MRLSLPLCLSSPLGPGSSGGQWKDWQRQWADTHLEAQSHVICGPQWAKNFCTFKGNIPILWWAGSLKLPKNMVFRCRKERDEALKEGDRLRAGGVLGRFEAFWGFPQRTRFRWTAAKSPRGMSQRAARPQWTEGAAERCKVNCQRNPKDLIWSEGHGAIMDYFSDINREITDVLMLLVWNFDLSPKSILNIWIIWSSNDPLLWFPSSAVPGSLASYRWRFASDL